MLTTAPKQELAQGVCSMGTGHGAGAVQKRGIGCVLVGAGEKLVWAASWFRFRWWSGGGGVGVCSLAKKVWRVHMVHSTRH
jgi:hypothetical protein